MGFAEQVSKVRVLDPACGSGNFLYVALKSLLDLEKQISTFAATNGLSGFLPKTDPSQLFGIEINVYAHELASVVVWIGYIQWQHDNGFNFGSSPILKPLTNIRRMDAVLAHDRAGKLAEPNWPDAEVAIGNPPFVGGKKMRTELGDKYVDDLFTLWNGRVPREADFVTYWFEKARANIESGKINRAGLLATQGIRGGANRKVVDRIKESGDIFWAQSDRDWVLDGANVHISMIAFDNGADLQRQLDGKSVKNVNSDLTSTSDLTKALRLAENAGLAFMGVTRIGPFEVESSLASDLLALPLNPNGKPNSDVVRRWANGLDLTRRPRDMWIIDFGVDMSEADAALYEAPFELVKERVLPARRHNNREIYRLKWWLFGEPRPAMRKALKPLTRYIATPLVSKHRVCAWLSVDTVP
jgi:type II restriction/modification system DNA methylase subunit YeeA